MPQFPEYFLIYCSTCASS